MARASENGPVKVTLVHAVPVGARSADRVRAEQVFKYVTEGIHYEQMEKCIVEGTSVVEAVLAQAEGYDLIIVGATAEPLFKNLLLGSISEQIADRAAVTVVVVKGRSSPFHSFLRQTVLEPSAHGAKTSGG